MGVSWAFVPRLCDVDGHLCHGRDCTNAPGPAEPGDWEQPGVLLWALPMGVVVCLLTDLQFRHTDQAQVGPSHLTTSVFLFCENNTSAEGGVCVQSSTFHNILRKIILLKCLSDK